jgi:nanoRNase/pAp phosphatase (c-di-AMP/oligoRNAs hydrolase)
MDARTGLGRYKDYRISNYQLMYSLIDACTEMDIEQILQLTDVQERVQRYYEQDALVKKMITKHSRVEGNVIVTDLRDVDPIHCGNRFLVYAMYPEQNTSIWIVNGFRNQNSVFACGHSILNRRSQTDIGPLMRRFGGGGHSAAGTCQVPHSEFDYTLATLLDAMHADEAGYCAKAA